MTGKGRWGSTASAPFPYEKVCSFSSGPKGQGTEMTERGRWSSTAKALFPQKRILSFSSSPQVQGSEATGRSRRSCFISYSQFSLGMLDHCWGEVVPWQLSLGEKRVLWLLHFTEPRHTSAAFPVSR